MTSPARNLLDEAARPSHLLHADAGSPAIAKPSVAHDGPCYLCGEPSPTGTAVRVRDALGPGFTDHDQCAARHASHVCVPCVWMLGGKPPDTFRLWSVVYREDRPAAPSNPKATYPHGQHTHWHRSRQMACVLPHERDLVP